LERLLSEDSLHNCFTGDAVAKPSNLHHRSIPPR
jgi:hypothetical protein